MRLVLPCLSLLLSVAAAHAQSRPMMRPQHATLTLMGGVSVWDLSGTGNSVILAGRVDRPLGTLWVIGEGSLATFSAAEQSGNNRYLIPEVQLQLQVPRTVAPYVGVGAGAMRRIAGLSPRLSALTTTAALGVRLWGLVPNGVIRGEFRMRGIGREFTGSAFESTGGIGWSF